MASFEQASDINILAETANLERIEVLKGPASTLFGEINPGGVINVVTKKPLSQPFYEAEVQIGSRDFFRPRIDFSGPLTQDGNLLYRLNALISNDDGFRDFNQNIQREFVAPVLTWKISDRTDLTVELEYLHEERPFDSGLVAFGDGVVDVPRDRITGEPRDFREQESFTTGYRFEHRFSEDWRIRQAFRYARQEDFGLFALPLSLNESTGILSRANGTSETLAELYALQTNLIGKFTTGSIQHTLLFGVDLGRNTTSDVINTSLLRPAFLNIFNPVYGQVGDPSRDVLSNDILRTSRLGVYLQDQIALSENLKLVGGLRYDAIEQELRSRPSFFVPGGRDREQTPDALSPRVGIVYQPIPEISLFTSYARSFSPNTGTTFNGNFLEAEEGEGYDIGVKAELLQSQLFATLAYYNITRQNVASPDPVNPFGSVASGEQRSQGFEFDLSGEILPGWNIVASYGYTDAEVIEDNVIDIGNRLAGIPKHSANLWTTYTIQRGSLEGLGVGIGFNLAGERQGDLRNSFQLNSYFLTNAAIFYNQENWRVAVNFKNIFDVNYIQGVPFTRTRGIEVGEPFTVFGSLSVNF